MVELSPYIGSVFGIKVQLHWTFVLLMLFTFAIAVVYPSFLYFFVIIVLLFVCVFVHELFHSITARRNKVEIKKIILLPIGGASVMDENAKIDPRVEYRIALVGPVVSILLGVIFGILVIYSPLGIIRELLQFLFIINILLGVFNLIPGFPLDGGRILRSYLQEKEGALEATKKTVKISNIFVWIFIIGTVIYAVLAPNYSFFSREFLVFWDVLIGLFIYDGSKAELQSTYIKAYSSKIRMKDAMTDKFFVVKEGVLVEDIYKKMLNKEGYVIVVKGAAGYRIINRLLDAGAFGKLKSKKVESISLPIQKVDYRKSLTNAVSIMNSSGIGAAVVVSGNRIRGVLLMRRIESLIALKTSTKNKVQKK